MKNLTDLRLSLRGTLFQSLAWKVDGHLFRRHRREDGIYLPTNMWVNFPSVSASKSGLPNSKDLGRELDIILDFPLIKDITLTTTVSFLKPGEYIKDSLPGSKGAGINTNFTAGMKWRF
jgi:hypothetical protein